MRGRSAPPVAGLIALVALACSSTGHGPSATSTGGRGGAGGASGAGAHATGGAEAGGAAGNAGAPCPGDPNLPPTPTAPAKLSDTGLYDAGGKLASYVQLYQPKYVLWSDGADKLRYLYVPKCSKIDTSDMDHWVFPVGTRVWKEFSLDGKRIETRMIHRFGPGAADWVFAAYQWNDAGTDADVVPAGVQNAKGTTHDIPPESDCLQCHSRLVERLLGLSAIQLSHDLTGLNIKSMSDGGMLTVPAPNGFTVPGSTPETQAALGYLHANCGNCHNSSLGVVDMHFRLLVGNTTVQSTDTYMTAVNKPATNFPCSGCLRIDPTNPSNSAVLLAMALRATSGSGTVPNQMPPLATELEDTTGEQSVKQWITALATPGGGL